MPVGSPLSGSFTTVPERGLGVARVIPERLNPSVLTIPAGPAW